MKKLMLGLVLSLASCANESETIRTLHAAGFTHVQDMHWDAWQCGKEDIWSTSFQAKNPSGKWVRGVVCCGLFKACTVRF